MIASCDLGSRKELNIGAQLLVPEVAFGSLRRLAVAEFLSQCGPKQVLT
jgi:hypothetical protein